ncbi:MAG: HAMP domain-containing protein [Anaerolineales bacterium]|nr:HAMP domain-containing protein [Anaerolineales bacterium]
MSLIISLLSETPFILPPSGWVGWIGLLVWVAVIFGLLRLGKAFQCSWTRGRIITLAVLLLATPFFSLFIGLRLPLWGALPPPGVILEPQGAASLLFSALPWLLAAGLLGPLPAAGLAVVSGLFLGFWDTHSIFSIFELPLLAVLYSLAFQQRYGTRFYRALRHPILTVMIIGALIPLVIVLDILFVSQGSLVSRMDYAFSLLWTRTVAIWAPLMIAGLVTQVIRITFPAAWGGQPPWVSSPAQRSLENRLITGLAPLAALLMIALMVADWVVAGNAARSMLRDRMAGAAETASSGIPYFLDTGQSLTRQFAVNLDLTTPDEITNQLMQDYYLVPYFRQFFIFDPQGQPLTGYPEMAFTLDEFSTQEKLGLNLALEGVMAQAYTLQPLPGEASARISFITPIGQEDAPQGVLIARTDLLTNPFAQPILASLNSLQTFSGTGLLVDEQGLILYHTDAKRLREDFQLDRFPEDTNFFDGAASDGTRQYTYVQKAVGRSWVVILTVPASAAQRLALQIAAPLLVMILLVAVTAFVILRLGLRLVTSSLQVLAQEAGRISQGNLDRALSVDGEDEVAQLRKAFEQMRRGLKARLDELNRLLLVSQGVASSFEIRDALQPIMESALATGASSARVVLAPAMLADTDLTEAGPSRFGLGPDTKQFAYLDDQLLYLLRTQDRILLTNPLRSTVLTFAPADFHPAALLAISLKHENSYYGALWVAYSQAHIFTEEEVRFLSTLAGQAALAASNNRLFMTAEVGRQRLAAILASTPDPVLVTDHLSRLLLANPAAWQVFGTDLQKGIGKPIEQVIRNDDLVALLQLETAEREALEIKFADDRIFLASSSPIEADAKSIGRICVLQDVTHFKELDALKSEFVATVSHDLRSPLTLMRGYATMLEMVGDLNDQQAGYVRKIVVGVESMSRLVNNLLDLGRIEADIGLQLEMVPVHDIVERVTDALHLQASQKKIELLTQIPQETIPLVEADQALLQQALQNLVENAIKYTPTNGQVRVVVRVRQNRMVFEVHDTGIGISPLDQPRLFEKFYRSTNRDAKRERGTGLGLAIVKSIAERHNGQVWVESQLGQGSHFYLAIPLRQSPITTF